MKKKLTNVRLASSLLSFAGNVEDDSATLTRAQIAEKLEANGVDVIKLQAATVERVRRLQALIPTEESLPGTRQTRRRNRELLVAQSSEPPQDDGDGSPS